MRPAFVGHLCELLVREGVPVWERGRARAPAIRRPLGRWGWPPAQALRATGLAASAESTADGVAARRSDRTLFAGEPVSAFPDQPDHACRNCQRRHRQHADPAL